MKHLKSLVILVVLLTILLVCFSSCGIIEDSLMALVEENSVVQKELCQNVIDSFISDGKITTPFLADASEEVISEIESEMAVVFNGVSTYELKALNWNSNLMNGYLTETVTFQIITDTDHIATIIVATDETDQMIGFTVNDVTDFTRSQKKFDIINIVLKIISLLFIAFSVWMIVDCTKRNIKLKPLGIIIILAGVLLSVTLSNEKFNFHLTLGIILTLSGINTNAIYETINTDILIPVGSIVYFFVRKLLPPPNKSKNTQNEQPILNDNMINNDHEQ